jgi:hypothetical protein
MCSNHGNQMATDTITMLMDPLRGRISNTHAIVAAGTSVFRFSIPLVSIIGTLTAGAQYLPLWALNSSIRLDIGLASAANAIAIVATSTSATFTVTNPKLNLSLVSISSIAQQQIQSMCNNVFTFHSTLWRTHKNVQPAGQMTNTITIPARGDSVKSAITVQRLSANAELVTRHSNLEFIKNNLSTYQWRVGSSFANPRPVDCEGSAVEAFIEAKKVFGNVTSESCPTLITYTDWNAQAAVAPAATRAAGTADHGCFAVCLEAEPFSQSKGGLISGTSTLASSLYLDLVFASAPLAADVLTFVEFDALYEIRADVGSMTVKF